MGNIIKILVISGDDKRRNIIISLLSNYDGFLIVGIGKDEFNTLIKSEQLKPDILILDLLSGNDELKLAHLVRRRSPYTSIIMMSDRDEVDYAAKALRIGISGFLLRESDINNLIPVIKIVNSGVYYVSPSIIKRTLEIITLIKQFPGQIFEIGEKDLLLSPVERSIITYFAQGFSIKEIAKYMNYNTGTIRNCLTSIKRKTKLKTGMQILIFSLVYGH
jgi:DNA-binding NarL/FixJ family response regulator